MIIKKLSLTFIFALIYILSCQSLNRNTQNDLNNTGSTDNEQNIDLTMSETESEPEEDINLLNVISTAELIDNMYNFIPPGIELITRNDKIIFNFFDLDYDSIHEVFVLGVQTAEDTDLNSFVDYSMLFKENTRPHHFFLYIFSAKEKITLLDTKDLGLQYVFVDMKRFRINNLNTFPFVICVTFQLQEGEIQKWLIFNNSIVPDSVLSLEHTFSSKLVIDDIDSDYNLDIIKMERGAEEGTGFETFLIWLKWNGSNFEEYAATNIVRNLKTFLNISKNYFLEHDLKSLVNNCFGNTSYYIDKGYSRNDIVFEAFGFKDVYNANNTDKNIILSGISNIVFPEIFENPFILEDETGLYFNLAFRIDDANGITIISEIPVYMNKNPFGEKQFYFRMN